jgi:transposase
MSKRVQRLTDEEWARIEPLLPRGRKSARRVDDRRVISGIVHMLESEARRLQIPTQAGHLFRFDRGHPSDLKPATIPI